MIYVIGDTQVRPGVENPLIAIAHHICELKPDYVVHLGDHWDFPSLSLYDKGKKSHRVKTYLEDVRAGNRAMEEFWDIIYKNWEGYAGCEFILLRGNHEERRSRAIEYGPDELVSLLEEFPMDDSGWEVVPFLQPVNVEGVMFSHYFQNPNSASAISSARQLCLKQHVSCVAGHLQGFDYCEMLTGDKKIIQCMIVGSSYYHDEEYKKHNNHHYRGTALLYNLDMCGQYDFSRYSMNWLRERVEERRRNLPPEGL